MNTAWATKWLSAYGDARYDEMMTMYADDVDFEDLVFGVKFDNKKDFRGLIDEFHALGHTHHYEVVRYVGGSDGGFIEWTWELTVKGEFLDIPADGKKIETRGVSVVSFNDEGLIFRQRDLWNADAVYRQLGAIS